MSDIFDGSFVCLRDVSYTVRMLLNSAAKKHVNGQRAGLTYDDRYNTHVSVFLIISFRVSESTTVIPVILFALNMAVDAQCRQ